MKTTCLISNFNYAQYVGEAIDGALRQTVPFDQIVVIDDGSSDGSLELLETRYRQYPVVQIISKSNEGQLSCFNAGFAHATGDIVFFLDADDVYEPDYLEKALDVYRQDASCDFVFCGRRLFGQQEQTLLAFPEDRDLGYSLIRTAYARSWIGAATSCLSMRRSLLRKILPLPFIDEWRIRADDCLVFGSSLAGAKKRFLAQPLVRYRVHGNNHHRDRTKSRCEIYQRRLAINRLFEHFERTLCFNTARLAEISHREFLTVEKPSIRQLMMYCRISAGARISIVQRLGYVAEMVWHFLGSLRQRATDVPNESLHTADSPQILPLQWRQHEAAISGCDATRLPRQTHRVA